MQIEIDDILSETKPEYHVERLRGIIASLCTASGFYADSIKQISARWCPLVGADETAWLEDFLLRNHQEIQHAVAAQTRDFFRKHPDHHT